MHPAQRFSRKNFPGDGKTDDRPHSVGHELIVPPAMPPGNRGCEIDRATHNRQDSPRDPDGCSR